MLRIAGFKNPDRFFKVVTPEQEKMLSSQMAQNKQIGRASCRERV